MSENVQPTAVKTVQAYHLRMGLFVTRAASRLPPRYRKTAVALPKKPKPSSVPSKGRKASDISKKRKTSSSWKIRKQVVVPIENDTVTPVPPQLPEPSGAPAEDLSVTALPPKHQRLAWRAAT